MFKVQQFSELNSNEAFHAVRSQELLSSQRSITQSSAKNSWPDTNRTTNIVYAGIARHKQQPLTIMKLLRLENGSLEIVTPGPLLKYNCHGSDGQMVQQLDEGRLFLFASVDQSKGAVEHDLRIKAFQDDPDQDGKRELEYLQAPTQNLSRDLIKATETYLGRFYVTNTSTVSTLGGSTMIESRTELAPMVIRPIDWHTHWDGQEMMELAVKAAVDRKKLLAASGACARMVIHMTGHAPQPRRALDAVEAWTRGVGSEQQMAQAMSENDPGCDDALCQMHQSADESRSCALNASLCDPKNVVASVANAVAAALEDRSKDVDFATLNLCQKRVNDITRAACANIVRSIIKVEEYPALTAEIVRRNEALCHAPNVDPFHWTVMEAAGN